MNSSEVLGVLNMDREKNIMIQPTTLEGAKDILRQYMGDEFCIVYTKIQGTTGYWLTEVHDLTMCAEINEMEGKHDPDPYGYCDCIECKGRAVPQAIARIPDIIMMELIDTGFVYTNIDDMEVKVQIALGTMPMYRTYQILSEAA